MSPGTGDSAPELAVTKWFNTPEPLSLAELRGQVVVIEAFQMLCPGCVADGLPLAQRIHRSFSDDLVVVGLHTVFEHHAAMTPTSLEAFLHEYHITFPVGVDAHDHCEPVPITMTRFGLQGTPSLLAIDRTGRLRAHAFGTIDELHLGATLGRLIDETPATEPEQAAQSAPIGCAIPTNKRSDHQHNDRTSP